MHNSERTINSAQQIRSKNREEKKTRRKALYEREVVQVDHAMHQRNGQ